MSDIFNSKKSVTEFLNNRERYLKSHITKDRFYSEKYQFLFGVHFNKENNRSAHCTYIKVENLDQSLDILKELEVYDKEKTEEKLKLINRDLVNGAHFPCYLILCEKFIRFVP